MAKYSYDKEPLKDLSVLPFLGEVKTRNKKIEEAPSEMPVSVFNANVLAESLHPKCQFLKIGQVIEHDDYKTFVLLPNNKLGSESVAYFRAGQYLSIALDIKGRTCCKPYTICSSPKEALGALNTSYQLTVKKTDKGVASDYILNNWKEGTSIVTSGPLGSFYYESLRDAKHVVAIAGGSGITPFYSMACAIADGIEDFDLTILYGSKTKDSIILKEELDNVVERSKGKVKVVHVLSDENVRGIEKGLINAPLIRKYLPEGDYSIFVCGPKAMYAFLEKELKKLKLPQRRIRFEVPGEYGDPTKDLLYPHDKAKKTYRIIVMVHGEEHIAFCKSEQSLLQAVEEAGIHAPSDCRSGVCGWCRSRLISGDIFIPDGKDKRKEADKKFGWIHPCITYPLSDITIEVFPNY